MQKLALLLSIIILAAGVSLAQTSGFTYQGKLADGGSSANGSYQFECKLFDAATDGNQVGPTQTVVSIVQNGIFTTRLDFGGAAFALGQDRWLEISVRLNGSPDPYEVLTPRQQVNSVPFAVWSQRAVTADNATYLGGFTSGDFARLNDPRLSDARPPLPGSPNYIQNTTVQQLGNFNINGNGKVGGTLTAGNFSGDGSGLTNVHGTFRWQVVAALNQQAQPNTGYVSVSTGQTTFTLPSSANVGDVVRISSATAGGWKISQNAGQSILLANLGSAGKDWTAYETDRNWTAVASSADGFKLVAAVRNGQIYTSTDSGVTWLARNAGVKQWASLASSADGTKLVAVASASQGGPNGVSQIYVSPDSGFTWTPRESPRDWTAVASSSDGTKLVAVGHGERIYTSTNSGVSWMPHDSSRNWQAVASSADGMKLVAVTSGNGRIYVSPDAGTSWAPQGTPNNWQSIASSADGSKLIAAASSSNLANSLLYTSTDSGQTWTIREQGKDWVSVASSADGSKLIAAVSNGQLYISSDGGVNWVAHETSRDWSAVASSADATKLIAVVLGGQIYTSSGSSSSTTTVGIGGNLVGAQSAAIELQCVLNGLWIPLSHEGAIVGH